MPTATKMATTRELAQEGLDLLARGTEPTHAIRGQLRFLADAVLAGDGAGLRERAESYARDARTFRDAAQLGQPVVSAEHDARWATVYSVIADELRKVAAEVR